jgi:hypothetical protein
MAIRLYYRKIRPKNVLLPDEKQISHDLFIYLRVMIQGFKGKELTRK